MSRDSATAETHIFVSYSHKDAAYLDKDSLLGYLKGLEYDGAKFWWDQSLRAGDVWDEEIKRNLLQADIALVLVSQWLLDSCYVRDVEVRSFLVRIQRDGLVIFPVILSACDWKRYGWLARLQHLPDGDKTLAQHYSRRGPREAMFLQIREALRARLKGKAPAELAIEATSGAVNLINSLESQYRSVVGAEPESSRDHSLRFEGLGTEIRVSHRGQLIRKITAANLRHLQPYELETITTLQKSMRHHHDRWLDLYSRRHEPGIEQQLRFLASNLSPDLEAVIHSLQDFGLDLEDHYSRFYYFVRSHAQPESGSTA